MIANFDVNQRENNYGGECLNMVHVGTSSRDVNDGNVNQITTQFDQGQQKWHRLLNGKHGWYLSNNGQYFLKLKNSLRWFR